MLGFYFIFFLCASEQGLGPSFWACIGFSQHFQSLKARLPHCRSLEDEDNAGRKMMPPQKPAQARMEEKEQLKAQGWGEKGHFLVSLGEISLPLLAAVRTRGTNVWQLREAAVDSSLFPSTIMERKIQPRPAPGGRTEARGCPSCQARGRGRVLPFPFSPFSSQHRRTPSLSHEAPRRWGLAVLPCCSQKIK